MEQMENRIGVLGAGYGGNNIGYSLVAQSLKGKYHDYFALDTNGKTINDILTRLGQEPARNKVERIQAIPLPTKGDGTGLDGSGTKIEVANAALVRKLDEIRAILQAIYVLFMCFALGKGTGAGTILEAVRLVLSMKGIIPVVVVSMPSVEAGECTTAERTKHRRLVIAVMKLGVRIIVLDDSALVTDPELAMMKRIDARPRLDLKIAQVLSCGMSLVFRDGSKIDPRDIADNLIAGCGYLVTIYGEIQPGGATEASAAPVDGQTEPLVEAASAQMAIQPQAALGEQLKQLERAFQEQLNEVWPSAAPNYYERGRPTCILVVIEGPWAPFEIRLLKLQVRRHFKASADCNILDADFDGPTNSQVKSFSVLCATDPRKPIDGCLEWVWERRIAQAAPVQEPQVIVDEPAPAPPVLIELPELERQAGVALRKVFENTTHPDRINFTHFVTQARGKDNPAALAIFRETDPQAFIQICQHIVKTLGGQPASFTISGQEIEDNLEQLSKLGLSGRISEAWKGFIVGLLQESGWWHLPEVLELQNNTGGKVTISPFTDTDERLTLATSSDLIPEAIQRARYIKWGRQTLGTDSFAKLKAGGNGGGRDAGVRIKSTVASVLGAAGAVLGRFVDHQK